MEANSFRNSKTIAEEAAAAADAEKKQLEGDAYSPYYDPHKGWDQVGSGEGGTSPIKGTSPSAAKNRIRSGSAARPDWDFTNRSFTFQLFDTSDSSHEEITLTINPENYAQVDPPRISITQTKGGFFVDHFGQGLSTVTVSGTTGYKLRDTTGMGPNKVSGASEFIALRNMYRKWLNKNKNEPGTGEMRFYDWSVDGFSYLVAITNFQWQRSVGRPLLYQYNISMTLLQKLSEKAKAEKDKTTQLILEERERASLASTSLGKQTGFINGITSGIGLENLPSAVRSFSTAVSKGMTFFDSFNQVYKTVGNVISEVENFNQNLEMFVAGATTFVTTPFELVTGMVQTIGDVIETLVSIADIPHEVVRSFREMMCAIIILPSKIFQGFTNPALFEGASNCGTTLGIPEASVASYNNSFSSTAQVPPQRSASQEFQEPQSTLNLKEEPLRVTGVFVVTDVARTGFNYLDSWSGRIVTLTTTPNVPVVVNYTVIQKTTKNMLVLETASAYIVKSGDSPTRIALVSYGDASRWKEIVLYNNLEYPYIVDDIDFEKEVIATGTVRFYRATGGSWVTGTLYYAGDYVKHNGTLYICLVGHTSGVFATDLGLGRWSVIGAVTIPLGSLVYSPAYRGTSQINFRTTQEVVLALTELYVDIPVVAEHFGEIGNAPTGTIIGFTAIVGIGSVYNISPTHGGKYWHVAITGDTIQIPKTQREVISAVVSRGISYEELFGIDITVRKDGEFDYGTEDIRDVVRVFGTKNLIQALRNRILTVKKFYPYSPTYGTNFPIYIGQKGVSRWYDLLRADIQEGVLLDPRIDELKSFKMTIDGDYVGIEFDAIPINERSSLPVNIIV